MRPRSDVVPPRPARLTAAALALAALFAPGCSDPSATKDSAIVTPPGAVAAPGGPIQPNVAPGKPAAKAEPL